MKIGIVSSGIDTLALFKIFNNYDDEYLVYCDQTNFPYEEKSLDYVLDKIVEAGEFLVSKGADVIVVDPIYELALKCGNKKLGFEVLPLFQAYLKNYAFKYSLVGKIGVLTDFGSCGDVQNFLEKEEKEYSPTDEQQKIKKFSYPFHYWVKPANSWVANVNDLGVHNPYLIRTMKNNLRYFKDAYVDTFLPMHWHYFRMQRAIKSFFNFHKIRFHDMSVVEECFRELINGKLKGKYSVNVWVNQPKDFIAHHKELIWSMQRGKTISINIEEI